MAVKVKRSGWARENSVTRSHRERNPRWKTKGSRGEPPCGHARHSPLFLRDASTSLLPPCSFLFLYFLFRHRSSYVLPRPVLHHLHRDCTGSGGSELTPSELCGPIDYRHFAMYENVSNGSDRKIR